MKRVKSKSITNAKANNLFSKEEIIDLRHEFLVLFKKDPRSYRHYSGEIGLDMAGRVLSDFLCERRGTTDYSLMKIRNYLNSRKSN